MKKSLFELTDEELDERIRQNRKVEKEAQLIAEGDVAGCGGCIKVLVCFVIFAGAVLGIIAFFR